MEQGHQEKEKTLYQWLDGWYQTYGKSSVRDSTSRCYQITVRIIKLWFENVGLSELEEDQIQDTFNLMAEVGVSKSSIKKVRFVLHQVYKQAVRRHVVSYDATGYVTIPPHAVEKEVHPLTVEQQRRVEQACVDDMHGDLILFLLYTGLRLGEMCNLQWKDYDKGRSEIRVRKSKTDAGVRSIPLLPESESIICLQPKINEYIFNFIKTKKPITSSVMRHTYLRLREKAGVSSLTNHVCRHTFATRLIEKGASPAAVSALLGHTNVAFTIQRYVRAQLEFLRSQISLLSGQPQQPLWIA